MKFQFIKGTTFEKELGNIQKYQCDFDGCFYSSNRPSRLIRHRAYIHDIDVVWHHCDQEGCEFKTKDKDTLKKHKANIHNVDVSWHHCDQEGCEYKSKSKAHLNIHKMHIHDLDVVWHYCDHEGCDYKCKDMGSIKKHKANIHNVDVSWHHCDQEGCDYKCKDKSHLKRHKENIHDIGDHLCDFCVCNRNSSIEYVDQHNNKSNICRKCFNKATGKNSRIEIIWSDYLDKHLGTAGLLSSDKSLISQGGCTKYRPDKIYIDERIVEIGECDEHQHSGASYSCDERRLSEIYEEDGIQGKFMYVLRWNPDGYFQENGIKKTRDERLEIYLALAKKLRLLEHLDKIHIYYLFYSFDNENITQNLPYTHIHSMEDVENLV